MLLYQLVSGQVFTFANSKSNKEYYCVHVIVSPSFRRVFYRDVKTNVTYQSTNNETEKQVVINPYIRASFH